MHSYVSVTQVPYCYCCSQSGKEFGSLLQKAFENYAQTKLRRPTSVHFIQCCQLIDNIIGFPLNRHSQLITIVANISFCLTKTNSKKSLHMLPDELYLNLGLLPWTAPPRVVFFPLSGEEKPADARLVECCPKCSQPYLSGWIHLQHSRQFPVHRMGTAFFYDDQVLLRCLPFWALPFVVLLQVAQVIVFKFGLKMSLELLDL